MLEAFTIQNYKSIEAMELSLGRVTVLIGENGAGKSNILEAIALASAASMDRLDHEFLASRGIRMPEPEMLRAAFAPNEDDIAFRIKNNNTSYKINLSLNTDHTVPKWSTLWFQEQTTTVQFDPQTGQFITTKSKQNSLNTPQHQIQFSFSITAKQFRRFIIYSPAYTTLRTFQAEGQILPLGIRGEGLFAHLKALAQKRRDCFDKIRQSLDLLGWYEDMNFQANPAPFETNLSIRDRYLCDQAAFDQRSVNEGFFFVLFYFTLLLSPDTPKFFAVDNIDASLNPKLCRRLVTELVRIAKEEDKQVIFTTHNPAVLDGLNLHDEEQALMVVKRDSDGRTIAQRVPPPKKTKRPIKLSEAFMRGYIGGLPENF